MDLSLKSTTSLAFSWERAASLDLSWNNVAILQSLGEVRYAWLSLGKGWQVLIFLGKR